MNPGFPKRGANPKRGNHYLVNFTWKWQENEENLARGRGGGRSKFVFVDPPLLLIHIDAIQTSDKMVSWYNH